MTIIGPLCQSICFRYKDRVAILRNIATVKTVMSRDVLGESLRRKSLFLTIARYSCWKNRDVSVHHPSAFLLDRLVKWHYAETA